MMKTVSALLLIFTIHSTALKTNKEKRTKNNDEITISPPITDADYLKQLLRYEEIGEDKLDEEVAASKAREDTLSSLHRVLKKKLHMHFGKHMPDPETWKILDFGSGVGAATRDLRDRFPGALVTGFDFNFHTVVRAQKETKYNDENIKFVNALPTEKYDLVVCENMLQPQNRKEALAQVDALLSYVEKEGFLYIAFKEDTQYNLLLGALDSIIERQFYSRWYVSKDPARKPKHDDFFENIPKEIVQEIKANGGELPADLVDELKSQYGGEMPADFLDKIKAAANKPPSAAGLDEAGLYFPWIMVQNVAPYQ